MTKDKALEGFQNLHNEIDKNNHLFVGTINPEWIQLAIDALKQTQWIPCSERLPRKDEIVFVYLFGNSPYLAWWDGRDWDTEDFTVDRSEEPTAWMPLPKPYEGRTE